MSTSAGSNTNNKSELSTAALPKILRLKLLNGQILRLPLSNPVSVEPASSCKPTVSLTSERITIKTTDSPDSLVKGIIADYLETETPDSIDNEITILYVSPPTQTMNSQAEEKGKTLPRPVVTNSQPPKNSIRLQQGAWAKPYIAKRPVSRDIIVTGVVGPEEYAYLRPLINNPTRYEAARLNLHEYKRSTAANLTSDGWLIVLQQNEIKDTGRLVLYSAIDQERCGISDRLVPHLMPRTHAMKLKEVWGKLQSKRQKALGSIAANQGSKKVGTLAKNKKRCRVEVH